MDILITSQRYWPENFRITDIAEELVKLGHSVTVLTGLPNYPKGYVFDEYKKGKNRIQEHNGVHIIRAREFARRQNVASRFLNYYSFPFFCKKVIRKMKHKYDVVLINNSSPILSSRAGLYYKKKYGSKVVMYEMDLWPESLLAGGVSRDSIIYNHYKKVSIEIYKQTDKILVSTKEHIDYIKNLPGCSELDVEYLPQYAESIFENVSTGKSASNGIFHLTFAGYIGSAQNVDVIIRAANILKEHKNIVFDILGDGKEKSRLEEDARKLGLANVVFHGHRPLEEMPRFYANSDAMLVTLENSSYANITIPGKVQSYMAAGKPIIASINGATYNLVKEAKCGYACQADDENELAEAVLEFCRNEKRTFGENAADYYQKHFLKQTFMQKLLECLKEFSD